MQGMLGVYVVESSVLQLFMSSLPVALHWSNQDVLTMMSPDWGPVWAFPLVLVCGCLLGVLCGTLLYRSLLWGGVAIALSVTLSMGALAMVIISATWFSGLLALIWPVVGIGALVLIGVGEWMTWRFVREYRVR
jgi:hypothetical protein